MTDASMAGRFAGTDFRVGRVFSRSMSLLAGHWLTFPIITGVAYIPSLFIAPISEQMISGGPAAAISPGLGLLMLVAGLVMFVLLFLSQGVIVHAAFQAMRSQRIDLGEAVKTAFRRFFPILGIVMIWLLAALGLGIGIFGAGGVLAFALGAPLLTILFGLVFLVAMVILATMWFVALQACVVERTGVFASLRRSTQLTKGNRWRIFGLLLVVMVIGVIVGMVVGALAGAMSLLTGAIVVTIVTFVWQAVWGAYYAITGVVTYHDLRVAKEGIDIEQIAAVFD
jgi:hypothetical protein